jgi:hypothetical protein
MRWAACIALILGSALFVPIITYGQSTPNGPLTGGISQNEPVLGPEETHDPQGYQKGEGYLPYSQIQEKQILQGLYVVRDKLTATVSCSHNDGDTIGPGTVPSGSNAHWIKVAAQVHRTANGSTLEIYYLEDRDGNIWSSREYNVGKVAHPPNDAGNHMKLIDLTPQHPPGSCLPPKPNPGATCQAKLMTSSLRGSNGACPARHRNPPHNAFCTIYIDVEGCPWHMPMHIHCDGSDQQAWTAEESKDAYQYTQAQWTHPQVCNPCPPPPCVYTIDPWFGQFMGPAPS